MKIEDYATIHRQLGFLEGATFNLPNDVYDAVLGAIAMIEEIVDEEMVGDKK